MDARNTRKHLPHFRREFTALQVEAEGGRHL